MVALEGSNPFNFYVDLGDAAYFTTYTVEDGKILFAFSVPADLLETSAFVSIKAEEVLSDENPNPASLMQIIGFTMTNE